MHTNIFQRCVKSGRLLRPLFVLAATAALGLAISSHAFAAAPAATTYRIIPLSTASSNADINASGQVAFTEFLDGVARAKFYDGRTIIDIGTLGGGFAAIGAINDAGQVTGLSATRDGITHAFRWSRGSGMIDLAPRGSGYSAGDDINSKGWVTGSAQFPPGRFHAFRWTPSTGLVDLGSLNMSSSGFAINDAGTVVGVSESVEGGLGQTAVRWPGTTPIAMTPFATPFTAAWGINNAGQIVGNGGLEPTFSDRAFFWSASTGLIDMGVSAADVASAEHINEKGLAIGNLYAPSNSRGFVWSRELGATVFGTAGIDNTATSDLNNLGQVVGTYNGRAFVWTRAEGMVDLNTRLAHAPPDLELGLALAISDNGSIVAAGNTGLVLLVPRTSGYGEAPVVSPIKITGTPRVNALLSFHAGFKDVDLRETHKASWDWGDGSTSVGTVSEKNGAGSVSGQHAWRKAGTYTVKLTVTDSGGKRTTVKRTVVVCGSGAAIVGEGNFLSPAAATKLAGARSSLAAFSFSLDAGNSGQALVSFSVRALAFRSSRIEFGAVKGGQAELRGSGSVNGVGGYRFVMSAASGAASGKGDRFRIRISHTQPGTNAEVVDYDNQAAGSVAASGSVVVQSE